MKKPKNTLCFIEHYSNKPKYVSKTLRTLSMLRSKEEIEKQVQASIDMIEKIAVEAEVE